MKSMEMKNRRAEYIDIQDELKANGNPLSAEELKNFEEFDAVYRSLCALMYNYVPMSGHPGGSISSGQFVSSLLFETMDYDMSNPDRQEADLISYAAGHKALGLYGMWALRNEVVRISKPGLLPKNGKLQLRLEDLLGFRRNPVNKTPLFSEFKSKPLDGHPTPATPFLKLATGASGVGLASSLGLAIGAADYYGKDAPYVHIVEGEGGMTPGRVAETFATAGTASLKNTIIHIDWNQASIDSNKVCRDGNVPGDYVQWDPMEFAYLYDWNVIYVPDGTDFQQVVAAQRRAKEFKNDQPTAIVYRTTKGWKYGIEGKASHGAGHKLCSDAFFETVSNLTDGAKRKIPRCEMTNQTCSGGKDSKQVEECFWEALMIVREHFEKHREMTDAMASRIENSKKRLDDLKRKPRKKAPEVENIYEAAEKALNQIDPSCALKADTSTTLRAELGKVLNFYNEKSGGAIMAGSADLMGSTSVNLSAKGFAEGFYHYEENPEARLMSMGGICEDSMCGVLSGLSSYGRHLGVGSSYGAFIAPLGHIAARLHAIGNQSRQAIEKGPYKPFILICGHAGLKTGEDGPTHADPQPLQLMQENFAPNTVITLTPWDPQEVWPLMAASLAKRPAVIVPFVTRPSEPIFSRKKLGLAEAKECTKGLYALRQAKGKGDGSIVLQGSGVTYAFVQDALPLLEKEGVDLNIYYVASAELFNALPKEEREKIFPESSAQEAMGITGFTLPTMYRWITSERGRAATLYPFKQGHYLGSGKAEMVLAEAGLDGESQFKAILRYVKGPASRKASASKNSTAPASA